MITIGNKSRGDEGIYVGRPSILGNEFEIGKDGTRSEVIFKYDKAFEDKLKDPKFNEKFLELVELAKHKDICLVCWCDPLPCHACVIKKYIEIELNKQKISKIFK